MKRTCKRFLAIAMTLAIVLSMLPLSAMAEDAVPHQHNYTSAVTQEATCGAAGVTTFTCAVEGCDRPTYTEAIAATGNHNYAEGACTVCGGAEHQHNYTSAVTQEATCGAAGVTTFTCTVEGCDRPTYTEPIAATGNHNYAEGVCTVCGAAEPAVCDGTENCTAETHETTCECYDWCAALGCTEEVHHADCPWGPCTLTEGCKLVKGHEGECTGMAAFIAVAKVGETPYNTLAEAMANAASGSTITLLDNVIVDSETYTIADGKSVTLDMNSKKITVTDKKTSNYELFYIYGGLTVTGNGTIELTATSNRAWNAMSVIFHNRGGVLTIQNGTFKHLGGTDMAFTIDNSGNYYGDATTNIQGGTLNSTYTAIRNRMEQNSHGASGKAILNISGGSISGTTSAVWAQAASTSTTAPATGEINVSGGSVGLINTARSDGAECMTTISGGTVAAFKGEAGELTVKGSGAISGTVTLMDAAGKEVGVAVTEEGLYIACEAKIGDKPYTTLAEAIAEAKAGETVKLMADITQTESLTIEKTVTLDLNGKTLSGVPAEAKAFATITNKGNLTITGGGTVNCDHKLAGSTSYAVNTIVNSGVLTISGVNIENKSTASNQIGYAIDNNSTVGNAVLTIQSGKLTASGSNYYDAIRLFCNSETAENSVTVNGGEISSIWLQNPSDGAQKNTKNVKGNVTITGGSVGALYLEPSSAFHASVSGGEVGSIAYNQSAEGRDLTGFITGGTFSANVSKFCAEGYAVEYKNNKYTVVRKTVISDYDDNSAVKAPTNVIVQGLDASKQNQITSAAKEQITNNAAATQSSGLTDAANAAAVQSTGEDLVTELKQNGTIADNAVITKETVITITLETIKGEGEEIKELTFDVEPQVVVKVGGEVKGSAKIEDLQKAIVFRLPIPSSFTADFVNIYHEGIRMNSIPLLVMGTAPNRYVEIASDSFSAFTVAATDDSESPKVAAIGNVGYATLEAAVKAAKTGETVEVLVDAIDESISVKLDQSITIDGNGATMTGELWLGNDNYSYGDGTKANISVKVTGFNFQGKGLAVVDIKTVEITGNTFRNISATNSTNIPNKNAVKVWYADNAAVSGNTIDTTGEAGIQCYYISGTATITNNTVKNTAHNAILVDTSNEAVITGNTLQNWGTGGEGRALRANLSELTFTGNTMNHTNAPEEYVKVTGFTDASKINLENNNWDRKKPTAAMVAAAGVTISEYVGKPVVAKIGNTSYTEMATALTNATDGQTIDLQMDVTLTENIVVGKNLTINANGHAIKGSNVTLKPASGKTLRLIGLGTNAKLGVDLSANDTATADADGVITVATAGTEYGSMTLLSKDSQTGIISSRKVFVASGTKLVIKSTSTGFDKNTFNGEYMLDMPNKDKVYSGTLNADDLYTEYRNYENIYVRGTNNTLTIVSSAFFDTCKRIYVDNSTVYLKETNYSMANVLVARGCTELEMKSGFLTTLATGKHTVKFVHMIDTNGDGVQDECVTTAEFWVKSSGSVADPTCPKTGDYIMIAVGVLGVSVAALAVLLIIRKKKS